MSSMHYLLSSPQGFPLSTCSFNNNNAEPNWRNISRLIAFVANIFPRQEEIQFSDGNRTFFSQPQATASGKHYFVTFFSGDGESLDLSSISRYVGYVTSVLFQFKLEACFKHLEQRTEDLIRSSTCNNTVQNDGSDDQDINDPRSLLVGDFPDLMEGLSVFEEHLIPQLLRRGLSFGNYWFQPKADHYSSHFATSAAIMPPICSVYTVTRDGLVSLLSSSHSSQTGTGLMNRYFESTLVEYAYSSHQYSDDSYTAMNCEVDDCASLPRSHLLKVSVTDDYSEDDEQQGDGSYFAVTAFYQVDALLLFVCPVPAAAIQEHSRINLPRILSGITAISAGEYHRLSAGEIEVFPFNTLEAEFCDVYRTSLCNIRRALFLSYNGNDSLMSADIYENIIQPKGSFKGSIISAFKSFSSDKSDKRNKRNARNTNNTANAEAHPLTNPLTGAPEDGEYDRNRENNRHEEGEETEETKENNPDPEPDSRPDPNEVQYFPHPPESLPKSLQSTFKALQNRGQKMSMSNSPSRPGRHYV